MKLGHLAWPRLGAGAIALFLGVAAVLSSAHAQQKRPNIAMLTDDDSWNDLGAYSGAGFGRPTSNADLTAKDSAVRAPQPGMARVWVLQQPSAPGSSVAAAEPTVFANGAALAQSAQGTAFFHDFRPGTYRFMVPPYGTANLVATLRLAPGTVAYVRVQPVPNATAGGARFAVLTMSPGEAKAYLPMLTYLGQR
jgi:hypothetical protein